MRVWWNCKLLLISRPYSLTTNCYLKVYNIHNKNRTPPLDKNIISMS